VSVLHPKGSQHFGPVQNFAKDAGEIGCLGDGLRAQQLGVGLLHVALQIAGTGSGLCLGLVEVDLGEAQARRIDDALPDEALGLAGATAWAVRVEQATASSQELAKLMPGTRQPLPGVVDRAWRSQGRWPRSEFAL
jgi:hypothetical protein